MFAALTNRTCPLPLINEITIRAAPATTTLKGCAQGSKSGLMMKCPHDDRALSAGKNQTARARAHPAILSDVVGSDVL